jgi:septum formation protein
VSELQQLRSLVLASGSPRRREILEQLGVRFRVDVSGIDETLLPGETPRAHVQRLARDKGLAVRDRLQGAADAPCVLSADTIVWLNDVVYGKPTDDSDALRMLRMLSGRTHQVLTGLALCDAAGSFAEVAVHTTAVTFCELSEHTMRRYIASGEARDKAGSYAIQGLGTGMVRAIDGSYTNVVGMPAAETIELLQRAGVLASWP